MGNFSKTILFFSFLALISILVASLYFPSWNWRAWFTGGVFFLTFYVLIAELRPPHITMFLSSAILTVVGIISPAQLMQGFSNEVIMIIAMLCVVVGALEINGVLNFISKHVLSKSKKPFKQHLSIFWPVSFISAFTNNTVVVLMMMPLVRKWAVNNQLTLSKFLIPLSYASILGGLCTLIGTSTNLIVEGLMSHYDSRSHLSFFELSYIGIPCLFVGFLYFMLIGFRLLPSREDPATAMTHETPRIVLEFIVEKNSPIIYKTLEEASKEFFEGRQVVEIERREAIINNPEPNEIVEPMDRLIFVANIEEVSELNKIKDLQFSGDPHFHFDASSSHFSEVVIARTSLLAGKTLRRVKFRSEYGASVMAIYRNGKRLQGRIDDAILEPGDTLILFTNEPWTGEEDFNTDFYFIRMNEKIRKIDSLRSTFVLSVFIIMIVLTILGLPLILSSLAAATVLMLSRCITMKDAQRSILWSILLLIGSSISFGSAMQSTGLAEGIAKSILVFLGSDPYLLIGGILLVTIISTEFLSNNASALLLFPIAIQMVQIVGYTSPEAVKTIGITIAVGSSCGFAIPTGYQTHMIVYGPGGYRFSDFIKVGIPLDLIILALGTILIPNIWPLGPHSAG